MKKFLISLFCKKSALVITTICASATIATTAVVIPNCLSSKDEKLEDVVVGESTKQLQNKMDAENKEESYTEDEVTTLETASNEDKQIGVIVDSQSYESSETKNLANEKEQETTKPKAQTQVAPTTSKTEEQKEPETQVPAVSSKTEVKEEKEPETTEPKEQTQVSSTTPKAEEQKEPEKQVPAVSSETEVKEEKEQETTEPKEQTSVASATPKVEEESKTTETKKEEPKASETQEAEEKQETEVTKPEEKTPTTSTAPKAEEEQEQEETEPKEQTPVVSEAKENQEQKETETKKEETPKAPATQEVEQQKSESEEVESEKQTPTVSNKSETETKEPEATPSTSKTEEKVQQNNEELIKIIQEAVEKTKNADSAYLTKYRTSIYPENSKIKYNKSQNRRLYIDGDVEEYLEGFPGRYTTEFNASRYYYQTYWRKNQETNQWEKQGTIHSSFGISELGYLREIKSVEKLDIKGCPFSVYDITLDKSFANIAGANLLNTPNLFKTDVKLTIMIDHKGYIVSIDCNWTKDVLNNPSLGPITMKIHMGNFNETKVDKPKDLKEEPVNNQDTRNELTPTKKEIIKSSIYDAYKKTYNANSATYNLNGKEVKYDIKSNSALIENTDGTTTYYKGTDNKYVDHNYVTPEFHQDSWTKAKDSEVWKENVKKHTCFIPKELYFLNIIFDVKKVEEAEDMTTYTIEVLKQYANNAYSYSNNTSDNKFNSNITFTVSVDKAGYIREIHIDSEGYKLDLVISDINNTNVERPEGIK